MINWDEPIELSNGREAVFVQKREGGGAKVKIVGGYAPRYDDNYAGTANEWNYNDDGTWIGGGPSYYRVVNVARPEQFIPEDWS